MSCSTILCFDKLSSIALIRKYKENIKNYIVTSSNISSSSVKEIVESKTAETYVSTIERVFELDFLTGSLPFTILFQNDNVDTFIRKKHLFYDKTSNSKSNNAQPALKKLFEWISATSVLQCPCNKCNLFLSNIKGNISCVSKICGNCLCGDALHENQTFGCHRRDSNGNVVCLGAKQCSNCNYYLPSCCFSKMFQGIKQKYELENIITQKLYLCNKCSFKSNVHKQWGHQKKASTLHSSFYHGNHTMRRKKRKFNLLVPNNNEVVAVDKTTCLATHKDTETFVKKYYNNLKKSLKWVQDKKQEFISQYQKMVQATITKIKCCKRITPIETNLLRNIVSRYEVIDKSFIKFHEQKKFVLIPKKLQRIQLKENKRHIILLKRKRKEFDSTVHTEEDKERRMRYMELWGFREKKRNKLSKNKKNNFRLITDNFEKN